MDDDNETRPEDREHDRNQPRPRAVFSTQDLRLIHAAVREHMLRNDDPATSAAYGNLLHRLGRLS